MTAATPSGGAASATLRAEHDELARRLEIRASIDHLRRGLVLLFVGLISMGVTVKLGFDRYGVLKPGVVRRALTGRPLFLWIATAATIALLVAALGALLRARRLGREEDRLFVRFRELRGLLGLDR